MKNLMETANFGRQVRERREELGMTIDQTAERSRRCDKTIGQIELGDTDPKLSTVLAISSVLDMDIGVLNSCKPPKEQ